MGATIEAEFEEEEDFVAWLAAQSDASLSGAELSDVFKRFNQRISRRQLLAYLQYAHQKKGWPKFETE